MKQKGGTKTTHTHNGGARIWVLGDDVPPLSFSFRTDSKDLTRLVSTQVKVVKEGWNR